MKRLLTLSLSFFFVVGCATVGLKVLDRLYGPEDPARYDHSGPTLAGVPNYAHDVKPILDHRCVVCHACYDAPCQLQLGSYEGITRGANPEKIYNASRLIEARTTRLFWDADTNAAWRKMGFFPVLNERRNDSETNLRASLLSEMLSLKKETPFPTEGDLPGDEFDFSLDRPQVCTGLEGIADYRKKNPNWGMPFGFPPLDTEAMETLTHWLESGAVQGPKQTVSKGALSRIASWESFLNADDLKSQLMARYIYEHWFLAHLYFEDLPVRQFFELVRSATPPGQPISLIATRRPYDPPGTPRVYYRFRPIEATLVSKTHMPYPLNPGKIERIKGWFIDADYKVDRLPSYDPDDSSNPFITFRAIPTYARYRLMLDEAQFTVMGFIKGPSCRGQTALDVIDDHFWISFATPEDPAFKDSSSFMSEALTHISLPTRDRSTALLVQWMSYARQQSDYLKRKAAYMDHRYKGRSSVTMNSLWDGDGHNPNAALTVFRHFDSASVEKGLLGGHPQKALVVGYEVLERIHYLLVAGFDVYGNLGHQLEARLYMDFLRMEAEHNALTALPKNVRMSVRDHWYRGASEEIKSYVLGEHNDYQQETGIPYVTHDPLNEFYDAWSAYLSPIQSHAYDLDSKKLGAGLVSKLQSLAAIKGRSLQYLPETSVLTVVGAKKTNRQFTILRNSAHSNIARLFDEENRRLPDEDTLYVASGIIGAYPNIFYRVNEEDLPEFTRRIARLSSGKDYADLAERFAIRRTNPGFWSHFDQVQKDFEVHAPVEAGILDLNRYENR
jgi:Fatty acid cis/trans isomerase (CTI)